MKLHPCSRPRAGMRACRSGFTLVELLVVTAILGVAVAAVAATLAGGIRAWDTARTFSAVELRSLAGLRIFQKDLMNAFPFYAVNFAGSPDRMSFASLVNVASGMDQPGRRIGTVTYGFDPGRAALIRRQQPFPGAGPATEQPEEIVGGLQHARFFYAAADSQAEQEWQENWTDATNYPAGIRIELVFGEQDEDTVVLTETVSLPVYAP